MAPIGTAVSTIAAALFLAISPGALGQAVSGSAPVLEVQRLAPQLLSFAGTPSNFDSLVNGLAQGTPVTLVTATPAGLIQAATFTPAGGLSAVEIARTLELARQDLITRGISAPSAEQIGVSLVGGSLPTPVGPASVAGVLAAGTAAAIPAASSGTSAALGARTDSPRLTVTTRPPAPAITSASPPTVTSTSASPPTMTSASPQTANTSASPSTRFTSDSPIPGTTPTAPAPSQPGTAASPALQNRR